MKLLITLIFFFLLVRALFGMLGYALRSFLLSAVNSSPNSNQRAAEFKQKDSSKVITLDPEDVEVIED